MPVFNKIFLLFSSQDNVDQTSAHGRRDLVEPGFQEPSNRISLNHQGKKQWVQIQSPWGKARVLWMQR